MTGFMVAILIFFSFYFVLSSVSTDTVPRKLLLSFVMSCAQIVMTQLVLGLAQALFISWLLLVNAVITALVLLYGFRNRKHSALIVLRADLEGAKRSFIAACDRFTVILMLLFVVTYGWILTAAYYLPPRGIDDNSYHLPPIFEYIQSHTIKLLSVELRHHFAFPQNAELLFMWPTLFAGNQRMLDGVNVLFVVVSVVAIYALFRDFEVSGKDALFTSFLYAFCPVVIMQSGVNYIDIIVALFFLLSLYFSLQFNSSRNITSLFAAGISIGLLLGMKYTALLLALPLQLLIVPGLFKVRRRFVFGYVASVLVMCGWWYARNLVVLHDPFYPFNFLGPLLGKSGGGGVFSNILVNLKTWPSRYLVGDIGVGTCDGGFGLLFWGLGFSSWLYYSVYSLMNSGKTKPSTWIMLACLPVGFLLLLAVPAEDVPETGRLAIFVVAIGLFTLCKTMQLLNDSTYSAILKSACIILSVFAASLLFDASKPHYNLGKVIQDRISRNITSEFKYGSYSERTVQSVYGSVWESLDYLTKDDKKGLYCRVIFDPPSFFFPAPVYGSKLQNRVVYSQKMAEEKIDAFVCTYVPKYKPIVLDDGTSSNDIVSSEEYVVVTHWNYGCLILHDQVFRRPDKKRLLAKYYMSTWPEAVNVAQQLVPHLKENIPFVTSSHIGYGLRYVDMRAKKTERAIIVPDNLEEEVVVRRKIQRCYSVGKPLPGFRYTPIAQVLYKNTDITIYLNRKQ